MNSIKHPSVATRFKPMPSINSIGIVKGMIVLVVLSIVFVLIFFMMRKKNQKKENDVTGTSQNTNLIEKRSVQQSDNSEDNPPQQSNNSGGNPPQQSNNSRGNLPQQSDNLGGNPPQQLTNPGGNPPQQANNSGDKISGKDHVSSQQSNNSADITSGEDNVSPSKNKVNTSDLPMSDNVIIPVLSSASSALSSLSQQEPQEEQQHIQSTAVAAVIIHPKTVQFSQSKRKKSLYPTLPSQPHQQKTNDSPLEHQPQQQHSTQFSQTTLPQETNKSLVLVLTSSSGTPISGSHTEPEVDNASDVTQVDKFDRTQVTNPDESLKAVPSTSVTRLNIESARRYTVRITEPRVELLRDYKTKQESPTSTNYLENWTQNSQTFQTLLEEMLSTVHYVFTQRYARSARTLNVTSNSPEVVRAVQVVEDFTERLLDRVEECDLSHHTLWGGSSAQWYTFGIMLNVYLGHHLLMELPKHLMRIVKFLKAYLPEPNQVTTTRYERRYENCLLGPWLLRHYFDGTIDTALVSDSYKKARAQLFPQLVYRANVNGLHIDLSYYAYSSSVAFNVIQEMVGPRSRMIYFLDSSLAGQPTYIAAYNAVTNMILHPRIKLGNLGVFGRRDTDECEYKSSASYGIKVLPCASMLIYKTLKTHFTVRGQRANVAFYVADHNNYSYALYWVQMRQRYRLDSKPKKLSSGTPMPGMICVKGKNALIPIMPKESLGVNLPNDAISCVFSWKEFGIMYQHYNIKEFGGYTVDELIVVDATDNVITVKLTVRNTTPDTTFEYYGENKLRAAIEPGQTKTFRSRLHEEQPNECEVFNWHVNIEQPISIGRELLGNKNMIELHHVDNTFILTDEGVPVLVLPPNDKEQEKQTFKCNGNLIHLQFNDSCNQWSTIQNTTKKL